jgi:hypothetical protein
MKNLNLSQPVLVVLVNDLQVENVSKNNKPIGFTQVPWQGIWWMLWLPVVGCIKHIAILDVRCI